MAHCTTLLTALTLALLPANVAAQVNALEVDGYGPAAFVSPGDSAVRPVVVALHGNFDRPEWMCGWWASIVRDRAFLLCPRGVARTDAPQLNRWSLPPAHLLAREVAAARRALEARYPGRLAPGPDVYVGFSQGAHRVARMAAATPEAFPRIQLVEGGNGMWRLPGARRYARHPGRVAVVCAMGWCESRSRRMARALERGRAQVQLERIPAEHADLASMAPGIQRTFDWLIADDPRFTSRASRRAAPVQESRRAGSASYRTQYPLAKCTRRAPLGPATASERTPKRPLGSTIGSAS